MMKAILSCTADDLYSFNLPFAVYSWYKLGVECIVFVPIDEYATTDGAVLRLGFSMGWCLKVAPNTRFVRFKAPAHKMATYAQCARLYAAAIPEVEDWDILITSDADMCVFNKDAWTSFELDLDIDIIGADLVPAGQVPMCYISAPVPIWREIMHINGRSCQECLDELLGGIDAEHFRGNYWAKDQEMAFNMIDEQKKFAVYRHNRAKPGTQFATRRADRDGWQVTPDIIDAHLPRPGYERENFIKIVHLFEDMYGDDCTWMKKYQHDYVVHRDRALRKG